MLNVDSNGHRETTKTVLKQQKARSKKHAVSVEGEVSSYHWRRQNIVLVSYTRYRER